MFRVFHPIPGTRRRLRPWRVDHGNLQALPSQDECATRNRTPTTHGLPAEKHAANRSVFRKAFRIPEVKFLQVSAAAGTCALALCFFDRCSVHAVMLVSRNHSFSPHWGTPHDDDPVGRECFVLTCHLGFLVRASRAPPRKKVRFPLPSIRGASSYDLHCMRAHFHSFPLL